MQNFVKISWNEQIIHFPSSPDSASFFSWIEKAFHPLFGIVLWKAKDDDDDEEDEAEEVAKVDLPQVSMVIWHLSSLEANGG